MSPHAARTPGYDCKTVQGVTRAFQATGDSVSAVFRAMPHSNEPARFQRIVGQPLGVVPGRRFDPTGVAQLYGARTSAWKSSWVHVEVLAYWF